MMNTLFQITDKDERITNLSKLVKCVKKLSGAVYFRGQIDKNLALLPTIARMGKDRYYAGQPVPTYDPLKQEQALLHRFRRRTYEHRGRVLTEWEALFLARHHGLPVRLMDWTTNPLVALYFACEYERKTTKDGVIWWFTRRNRANPVDVFSSSNPMAISGVRLIYPFYPTPRMTVQSGIFTIHGYPWLDLRFVSTNHYKPTECDILHGNRWIIPREAKAGLSQELSRFGINSKTLFPELDGLARGLLQDEVFRQRVEYQDDI
jgi:hypothetical protein